MKVGDVLTAEKSSVLKALDALRRDWRIIGPTRGVDGEVVFAEIASSQDLFFDYVNELDPIKRFFAPQTEPLFRFRLEGVPELQPPEPPPKQILFGVRSCDVKALEHWDKFYGGRFVDELYFARRERTVVVSLACNKPLPTCFCICTDTGPYLKSGFDVQLTDLGDRYLVEVGTEKGLAVLAQGGLEATEATEADLKQRAERMRQCDAQFVTTAYMAKGIIQLTQGRVKPELWEEMGRECFSCGACTHLCPMCTCFDVQDFMEDTTCGVRERCWDSCQYSGYTRETSGHNPRAATSRRVERRFFHKLSFQYMQQDGHHGCVGCGRCIISCQAMGLLDLPAVLKRLRREGQPVEPARTLPQD
ncbi:MAG: 4Fe-4S dicluster domain-containing protein [candidate division KSB1 bacterium]|nr:4Fe-4S dicluster domain-containing protein [candidate division KSB1 bacterium]